MSKHRQFKMPDPGKSRNLSAENFLNNNQPRKTITQQPKLGDEKTRRSVVSTPIRALAKAPASSDLDLLVPLNHLLIKQYFDGFELTEPKSTRQADILNWKGHRIFLATIEGGGTNIHIVDPFGNKTMVLKSLTQHCNPYLSFSECCLSSYVCGSMCRNMEVRLGNGNLLGRISHECSCYQPKYRIVDAYGMEVMRIFGSTFGDCCLCRCRCCRTGDFPIKDMKGKDIGLISKKWSKTFPHFMSKLDGDSFGVKFPNDLDVTWKALILASMFVIEMMYFAQSPKSSDLTDDEEFKEFKPRNTKV